MKISLFYKPMISWVYSFFIIFSFIAGTPLTADASFFSDISDLATSVFGGNQAQADETTSINSDNSQVLTILETGSVNPDVKNAVLPEEPIIGQGGAFIYNDDLSETDASNLKLDKSPLSDEISIYVVKEGDTLSEIADAFNISTNTIRWENNISGQTISVGQKLNILSVTGVKHIVKSGDTVSKIADKYEAESEDIYIFNGITKENGLKVGQVLIIPNGIIKPVVVSGTKSSSGGTSVPSNTKVQAGYYIRPIPGRVTSPYGSRHGSFHPGVDLAGVKGVTKVMAAADGAVTKVVRGCVEGRKSCGGGYGNHIEVVHANGTTTRYAHLTSSLVSVGQTVSQGEAIGILGNTGNSTGPHLHFEIINANGSKMRPPVQ